MYKQVTVGVATLFMMLGYAGADSPDGDQEGEYFPVKAREDFDNYCVEIRLKGSSANVDVIFDAPAFPREGASKILQKAIKGVVAKYGSREVIGEARDGDGECCTVGYSATTGKLHVFRGGEITTRNMGSYFVELDGKESFARSNPKPKRLRCFMVFPTRPSSKEFESAALAEVDRLQRQEPDVGFTEFDVTFHAYVGDKSAPLSWREVLPPIGKYTLAK